MPKWKKFSMEQAVQRVRVKELSLRNSCCYSALARAHHIQANSRETNHSHLHRRERDSLCMSGRHHTIHITHTKCTISLVTVGFARDDLWPNKRTCWHVMEYVQENKRPLHSRNTQGMIGGEGSSANGQH